MFQPEVVGPQLTDGVLYEIRFSLRTRRPTREEGKSHPLDRVLNNLLIDILFKY